MSEDEGEPLRASRCPARVEKSGRAAFSLIELMVALAILSIVLLAFGATVAASSTQRSVSEERRLAEQALSSYLEELREMTPAQALAEPGTSNPIIPGLRDVTRTLVTYQDEAGPGTSNVDHGGLAFPIDINGDGDKTDTAVPAASCLVLPTRLSLTWVGATQSTQEVRLYVYLSSF